MKALTIKNPYAWAIATGHKPVENRTRLASYRGDIAIHAGAAWYPDGDWDPRIIAAWHSAGRPTPTLSPTSWPRSWFGAVLAVAELHDSHVPTPGCCSSEWADPDTGAHWLLRDVRRLAEHVPARGALGLWTLPDDVERAVRVQLEGHDNSDTGCSVCGTCISHDSCADPDNPLDAARGDCSACGACGDCIKDCAQARARLTVPL